jgi:hypothetical protein
MFFTRQVGPQLYSYSGTHLVEGLTFESCASWDVSKVIIAEGRGKIDKASWV